MIAIRNFRHPARNNVAKEMQCRLFQPKATATSPMGTGLRPSGLPSPLAAQIPARSAGGQSPMQPWVPLLRADDPNRTTHRDIFAFIET
jgi:hypothetical protein